MCYLAGAMTWSVLGKCHACAIAQLYPPWNFLTYIKSEAMTVCKSHQCRAFSKAMMDKNFIVPIIPPLWLEGRLQMSGVLRYFGPLLDRIDRRQISICEILFSHIRYGFFRIKFFGENQTDISCELSIWQNKAGHFMWIFCLADDLDEISSLNFFEK